MSSTDNLVVEAGVPITRSIADRWPYKLFGRIMRGLMRLPSPVAANMWKRSRQNWPGKDITTNIDTTQATPGNVPVVWLAPKHSASGVMVCLHGGAYISGPLATEWSWMAEILKSTSVAVAAIIYRMPPDDPFPAALDDAVNAIAAMQDRGELVPDKWILSGSSAGGGLALAVVIKLIEMRRALPAGLLLNAPWVDIAMNNPDIEESERADGLLHRSWLGWTARLYANGHDLNDPLLSPLFGAFEGFPPTHVNVGTRDMFLPDIRRLKQKLLDAGAFVHYIEQEGGIHTYSLVLKTPEAQATFASQVKWIGRTLASRS